MSSGGRPPLPQSETGNVDCNNSQGTNESESELEDTKESLRIALAANHELQDKILSELQWIARRKRDNRLEAARCIESLCDTVPDCERRPKIFDQVEATNTMSPANQGNDPTKNQNDQNQGEEIANKRKKRKKNCRENDDYVPTSKEINQLLADEFDCQNRKGEKEETINTKWSLYQRKKFLYDPHRKWTLDYFSDPTGSLPKENDDIIQRRRLLMKRRAPKSASSVCIASPDQEVDEDMVPDNFFHHTSQPFTSQETIRLNEWLRSEKACHDSSYAEGDPGSFFERIATKLRKEHHEDPVARKKDKVLLPTCVPRSVEDIRFYYRNRLATQHEFTKQESLAILEGVEETRKEEERVRGNGEDDVPDGGDGGEEDGEKNDDANSEPPTRRPDWEKICERVRKIHRKSHSDSENSGEQDRNQNAGRKDTLITPYQCMVHYKTKLRRRPDGSFTPEEDELLLRYIAAMGPQFIWGTTEIADLATRLFPNKPVSRIYERTHFSQWHPLSKDTIWTKEEEQKLVLAMKVYSDVGGESERDGTLTAPNDDFGDEYDDGAARRSSDERKVQREQSARIASEKKTIRKAATHFHPERQLYKVVKKWKRSFSPRFSYQPFSKEEDLRLLEAVKSSAANTPFSEIAKQHFPNRSSDQLSQRWTKIAPDKDRVEKLVPFMIRSGMKRGLIKTRSSNDTTTNQNSTGNRFPNDNTAQNDSTSAIFDPNDFVVEVLPNQGQENESQESLEARGGARGGGRDKSIGQNQICFSDLG